MIIDPDPWPDGVLEFIVRRGFRFVSIDTAGEIKCWGLIRDPPWKTALAVVPGSTAPTG